LSAGSSTSIVLDIACNAAGVVADAALIASNAAIAAEAIGRRAAA